MKALQQGPQKSHLFGSGLPRHEGTEQLQERGEKVGKHPAHTVQDDPEAGGGLLRREGWGHDLQDTPQSSDTEEVLPYRQTPSFSNISHVLTSYFH